MNLKDIVAMLNVLLQSLKLTLKGKVSLWFIVSILSIKILRSLGAKYFIVRYNKNLSYVCPLDQKCDWYHITAETFAFNGVFEPKYGEVVIDVGANIGIYSMWCAEKLRGSRGIVVAIEPEPRNFNNLIKNIDLNGFSNVIAMNLAVADYNGKVRLYITTPTGHTTTKNFALTYLSKRSKDDAEISYIEVPCKTLDKIISELSYSNVDLLNLDVENAALVVLKGAKNALEKKIISRIKIEVENEKEVPLLVELLRTFSYRVFRHGITLYAIA